MSLIWLSVVGLAFFLAWNLGANDVANAMGTSVGSKALTLRQAIVLAGILEFSGALLFGQEVTVTLSGKVSSLALFEHQPSLFVLSIISELLATSLWLLCATWRGWPVASSHAAVGAITGVNVVLFGIGSLDGSTLGTITLGWVLTPLVSGLISAALFMVLQKEVLSQPQPLERWHHWQPWISATVLGLIGSLVLPTVIRPVIQPLQQYWALPVHDYVLGMQLLCIFGLVLWTGISRSAVETPPKQKQTEQLQIEQQLGKFQIVSACAMAFAHGSNDVGNAIAPLASFDLYWQTQIVPQTVETVPIWILGLGGIGIVSGLAALGQRVIVTVGEKLLTLTPSYGFCAELGAATTILMASRWGLPLSTTHALIGSVVGIGLVQKQPLQWSTLRQILGAWIVTVPAAAALGASLFKVLCLFQAR